MVEVGEVEVVYATYHVDVGETPFFVALDYTRKKVRTRTCFRHLAIEVNQTHFPSPFSHYRLTNQQVVVSIRGTLSMKDVMTDLNAEAEVIPLTPPRDDWLGHKGMVHAAEYIRKKIHEEGIITRALAKVRQSKIITVWGWKLTYGLCLICIRIRPEVLISSVWH